MLTTVYDANGAKGCVLIGALVTHRADISRNFTKMPMRVVYNVRRKPMLSLTRDIRGKKAFASNMRGKRWCL